MEEQKYQHGFNNGYILAQHKPELFVDISKTLEPANDYLAGFLSGGKQHQLDLTKSHVKPKHEHKDQQKDRGERDKF